DITEKDDRWIVDFKQNHTLANLVRKAVWANDGEAGYDKGHPLGEESHLIVKSDSPEEDLEAAIDTAREWMEDLQGQVS
ncbi:MAG: RpoL/Rpb11 RNA polymerase subunit family protein, partial [Candidatus Nanohalobium sp.]